jgi:hypothetical protein
MDSTTYNDETVVQRTSPIGDGGLSAPHTNFGGGWLGARRPKYVHIDGSQNS